MTVAFRPMFSGQEFTRTHPALWAFSVRDGRLAMLTGQTLTFTRTGAGSATDALGATQAIPQHQPSLQAFLNSLTALMEPAWLPEGVCTATADWPLQTAETWRLRLALTSGQAASGNLPAGYLLSRGATGSRLALSIPTTSRNIQAEVYDGTTTRTQTIAVPNAVGTFLDVVVDFALITTGAKCRLDIGSGYGAYSTATGAIASLTAEVVIGDCAWSLGNRSSLGIQQATIVSGSRTFSEVVGMP